MSAGKLNITIDQGALFEMIATVKDKTSGAVIDLTGFQFHGQMRLALSDNVVGASFSFAVQDQTALATKGKVRIYIPSVQTARIPCPQQVNGARQTVKYLYDIEYGPTGGESYRMLQGEALVSPEVTR